MAVAVLDAEVDELLQLLSKLPSNQLAIAITQHPNLSSIIVNALRDLAAAAITEPSSTSKISGNAQKQQGKRIADLARKLIARGDPSLVNRLLPRSSLIDLALCTNAKDVLARLVDETGANECIRAAILAFENASRGSGKAEEEMLPMIGRAAHLLARVASSMPISTIAEERLTKGQREKASEECELLCKAIKNIRGVYEDIRGTDTLPALKTKISLLDAAWSLSERLLMGPVKSSTRGTSKVLDDLLTSLCGSSNLQAGDTPLSNLPLAVDMALVRPILERIKAVTKSYTSANLDILEKRAKSFTRASQTGLDLDGSAWALIKSSVQPERVEHELSESLVDTIIAILPHLGDDRGGLQERLKRPQYAGKDTETIIQILFDEEDGAVMEQGESKANKDLEALRLLRERANVFNEQPLEGAKVIRGKGRETEADRFEMSSGLSEDIRAAILARAEQPDSDEEEVWNPFNDAVMEAGFEEEMEEELETTTKPAARRNIVEDDDDEEEEDGDEIEEGEADGVRGAAGHGGDATESSKVAAERAAERILISTWSERGGSFFSKEGRKAGARAELKAKLNDLPGKRWDDGLIESWATMFSRNPRKEKLLAAVDDIMLLGNQNLAGTGSSGFGVNRGRGGRIMREQVDGGRGGGGRGRGRGSSRGGRGGAKRGRGAA